nr:beta-lactamase family protein [Fimbriimonadaceae bacterium]
YGSAQEMQVGAVGRLGHPGSASVTPSTPYDLASLTKVIATTTLVWQCVEDGLVSLDTLVEEFLPETRWPGVTVRNLLLHDSGLPPYLDLRHQCDVSAKVMELTLQDPPGEVSRYSCLGFIALRTIVERLRNDSFDVLFEQRVASDLGSTTLGFRPLLRKIDGSDCPPTGAKPQWRQDIERSLNLPDARGGEIVGVVHDPLAFLQGGVSGNAGLFGSAKDVGAFSQLVLKNINRSGNTYHEWCGQQGAGSTRGLGWDTKSEADSSAGDLMPPEAFGHTGFVGTALWICPSIELFGVLLTNRTFYGDDHPGIHQVRRAFFDLVVKGH